MRVLNLRGLIKLHFFRADKIKKSEHGWLGTSFCQPKFKIKKSLCKSSLFWFALSCRFIKYSQAAGAAAKQGHFISKMDCS